MLTPSISELVLRRDQLVVGRLQDQPQILDLAPKNCKSEKKAPRATVTANHHAAVHNEVSEPHLLQLVAQTEGSAADC